MQSESLNIRLQAFQTKIISTLIILSIDEWYGMHNTNVENESQHNH
jgi:hypothetical protein